MSSVIPNGWEEKKLGDICEILDSRRKPVTKKDRIEGQYPYYGATGILDHVSEWLFDEELVLLGEDGAKWGAGDKSAYRVSGKTWINNHVHVLRPNRTKILDSYLIYFLNHKDIMPYITGTTVPKLNQDKMKQIPILYPFLPEQQRIVEKLDKIFAELDKEKNIAEQNLSNTKELFESYLNDAFTQNTGTWEERKLGDICDFYRGLTYSKRDEVDYSSNVVLRSNNITLANQLCLDELKYLRDNFEIPDEKKVAKDNLMICISNGSKNHLGKIAYIDQNYNYAFGGFMGILKPQNSVWAKFLYFILSSSKYRNFICNLTDGANINNLKWDNLKIFSLKIPSLTEQQQIVEKLEALQSQTQKLEQIYTQKIQLIEELKQSILHKAFEGEL